MSAADNGGPAFPAPNAGVEHFGDCSAYMGLSLRDYFAAKAIPALTAMTHEELMELTGNYDGGTTNGLIAEGAYSIAYSMLSERAKP